MKFSADLLLMGSMLLVSTTECQAYVIPRTKNPSPSTFRFAETTTNVMMSTEDVAPDPTTFREAEVLGLRLMQEGNFEQALIGRFEQPSWLVGSICSSQWETDGLS